MRVLRRNFAVQSRRGAKGIVDSVIAANRAIATVFNESATNHPEATGTCQFAQNALSNVIAAAIAAIFRPTSLETLRTTKTAIRGAKIATRRLTIGSPLDLQ